MFYNVIDSERSSPSSVSVVNDNGGLRDGQDVIENKRSIVTVPRDADDGFRKQSTYKKRLNRTVRLK